TSMRNFRARTDAKAWTLRERHDPAQPSSSAYLAVYGWVRGTVARGLLYSLLAQKRTCRDDLLLVRFRREADIQGRGPSMALAANAPRRTLAGSNPRAAPPAIAAGSIGVSVHVNEKKSIRRSQRSRRCRPIHSR